MLGREPIEAEIFLEGHATRHEDDVAGAHTDGGGNDDGNAELLASRIKLAPEIEDKEIERVDVDIDAPQKCVEIVVVDALREEREIEGRIDVLRHLGERLDLRSADRRHRRAHLTV